MPHALIWFDPPQVLLKSDAKKFGSILAVMPGAEAEEFEAAPGAYMYKKV